MAERVSIVGAGPIGLYLAGNLAESGIGVDVYDGKSSVDEGSRKASGILSKSGVDSLGVHFKGAEVNSFKGAMIHVNGSSMRIMSDATQAYVFDRGRFAKALYDRAVESGANVNLGKRISEDKIRSLSGKNRILVGADGAVSTVARSFRFPGIKEYVLTYKAEYRNANVYNKRMVELFFSENISTRFFGWVAPYSSSDLELGIGTSTRGKINSKEAFERFLGLERVQNMIGNADNIGTHASMIPISRRERTVKNNVLLVGDAAGQTKATTGGGIIFGMRCAGIAADAIRKHIEKGTQLSAYETMWRSKHGLDLKLHDIIHSSYSGPSSVLAGMINLSKVLGLDSFLSRYGDMDSPSLVLKRFFLRTLSEHNHTR